MSIFDKFLNRDIYGDLKRNILSYQKKLFKESDKIIKEQDFKQWLNSKKFLMPSLVLRMEFSNLYFNYRLNELLYTNKSIKHNEYMKLKESWVKDYTEKFWTLHEKFEEEQIMTQEEFARFFKVGEKI